MAQTEGWSPRSRLPPMSSCVASVQRSSFFGVSSFSSWNQAQAVACGIVGEDVRVTAPVQCRLYLLLHVMRGKPLVQQISKKLHRHGVVGLVFQRLDDMLHERHVRQRFSEQTFSRGNIRFSKSSPLWGD